MGAVHTYADPCVFKLEKKNEISYIGIYVYDILIVSPNEETIVDIGKKLSNEFKIKDLGEVAYCLGIEFLKVGNSICLTQKGYVADILKRFDMCDCKPVFTQWEPGTMLSIKNDFETDEDGEKLLYRELIGALNYLAVTTRPDISFVVSYLSQFNHCHGKAHWTAAKRVLRYLKGTMSTGICYQADKKPLTDFVDADWGSCHVDRRSYTGYVFVLNGGPISWESKKQRTAALSSTEAEYMRMSEATKELIYLQKFLQELNQEKLRNVEMYTDSQSALKLVENNSFHNRSKHIDMRYHFIREVMKKEDLIVKYVSTENMMADILTKGLSRLKRDRCMKMLGLKEVGILASPRGGVLEYFESSSRRINK